MRVPVVLPVARVTVQPDGELQVVVDGEPYAHDCALHRCDLKALIAEIASDLDSPVRVELREADGSSFTDIQTPPDHPAPPMQEPSPETVSPSLAGAGFRPGEEVALAYVVARQAADAEGNAAINLPPALLAATRSGLVLLGLTSQTVAPIEASA